MSRAIIIHGMPKKVDYYNSQSTESESNKHWIPWLQQKLCQHDILAQTPEMPKPYEPDYESWKREFEKYAPDEGTLLVGHSCGGGFIIRWLSENTDRKVAKVVLVAPWLDVEGYKKPLFDFDINRNITDQTLYGMDILHSTNDEIYMQTTLEKIKNSTNDIRYHEFVNYGHFCFGHSMKSHEFPELLQICVG
jgi:uncharacterized protein